MLRLDAGCITSRIIAHLDNNSKTVTCCNLFYYLAEVIVLRINTFRNNILHNLMLLLVHAFILRGVIATIAKP